MVMPIFNYLIGLFHTTVKVEAYFYREVCICQYLRMVEEVGRNIGIDNKKDK